MQVGYGDITATTALEEMTAVFLMLIGASRTHPPQPQIPLKQHQLLYPALQAFGWGLGL